MVFSMVQNRNHGRRIAVRGQLQCEFLFYTNKF